MYSFRHCYAQRHADAGAPVEVLAVLMGHKQVSTTLSAGHNVRADYGTSHCLKTYTRPPTGALVDPNTRVAPEAATAQPNASLPSGP